MEAGFAPDPFETNASGIDIELQHPSLTLPAARCRRLLGLVAREEGVDVRHVTVILADHPTVLALNRRYLDHDFHTDVLAFDLADEYGAVEGEIYVDLDTARERCSEFDTDFEDEALRYAVHGLLHLIGYSDKTDSARDQMRALEDRYLDAA